MCKSSILLPVRRECPCSFHAHGRWFIFRLSLFLGFLTAAVLVFTSRRRFALLLSPAGGPVDICPNGNRLVGGSQFTIGEFLCSANGGRYRFGLLAERNGDLAVWENDDNSDDSDDTPINKTILWSIPLYAEGANITLTMQLGGNAVVSDSSGGGVLFASHSSGPPGTFLELLEDGTVRVIMPSLQDNDNDDSSTQPPHVLWDSHVHYFCDSNDTPPKWKSAERASPNVSSVNATTLFHKVMAGYQGWFQTECDGQGGMTWRHWTNTGLRPDANASSRTVEMWPDLRDFNSSELCPTGYTFPNGANAPLFGSLRNSVIEKHVQWMHDYGIDGVFVQRFVSELPSYRCLQDQKLDQMRHHVERYGRVFANMYDISGTNENSVYAQIKNDWIHLVDDLSITRSDRYLQHEEKPIVAIWGFGFNHRVQNPERAAELIDWFKNKAPKKYQATLMGGVPGYWRTLGRDSLKEIEWADVYRSFDIISPWTVGRYRDNYEADKFKRNVIEPDVVECEQNGIDYFPVIYPGYSFANKDSSKKFNEIPRNGGHFLWNQMYNTIKAGSKQVYVAMFDEVDEGTAIFKVAETLAQTPAQGQWLTLDADGCHLPSDWYLRLVGNATNMLRETDSVPETIPALQELQCN